LILLGIELLPNHNESRTAIITSFHVRHHSFL
jgi:hypothetical protein